MLSISLFLQWCCLGNRLYIIIPSGMQLCPTSMCKTTNQKTDITFYAHINTYSVSVTNSVGVIPALIPALQFLILHLSWRLSYQWHDRSHAKGAKNNCVSDCLRPFSTACSLAVYTIVLCTSKLHGYGENRNCTCNDTMSGSYAFFCLDDAWQVIQEFKS